MAKISANGAREIARYKLDGGAAYIVCSDGRVLYRFRAGNKVLIGKYRTAEAAKQAAEAAAERQRREMAKRDPWTLG